MRHISVAHNLKVSMYVEVLSGAMDAWDTKLSGGALVDYALSCRAALAAQDVAAGVWPQATLVAEVVYDRALIMLAAEYGVDVAPTNFAHPRVERDRIELELAERGLDLRLRVRESGGQEESEEP